MMLLSSNPRPKRLHDSYTMYIESTAIVKRQNDSASDALDFTSGSAGTEFQFSTFSIKINQFWGSLLGFGNQISFFMAHKGINSQNLAQFEKIHQLADPTEYSNFLETCNCLSHFLMKSIIENLSSKGMWHSIYSSKKMGEGAPWVSTARC